MKVYIESRDFNKTVLVKGGTVGELMRKIKVNAENYVISRNGEIVLEDERLRDKDKIKLFPVVSGG